MSWEIKGHQDLWQCPSVVRLLPGMNDANQPTKPHEESGIITLVNAEGNPEPHMLLERISQNGGSSSSFETFGSLSLFSMLALDGGRSFAFDCGATAPVCLAFKTGTILSTTLDSNSSVFTDDIHALPKGTSLDFGHCDACRSS